MHVSHVILRVSDLAASVRFYRDQVGLPVEMETPGFAFVDAGTIRLTLNKLDDASIDVSTTEIVLEVDDIHSSHAALTERGVEFRLDPRAVTTGPGGTLFAADFRDPDGHLWSLTGWVDEDSKLRSD